MGPRRLLDRAVELRQAIYSQLRARMTAENACSWTCRLARISISSNPDSRERDASV